MNNTKELTQDEMKTTLEAFYSNELYDLPLYIWGEAGAGKSQVVFDFVKKVYKEEKTPFFFQSCTPNTSEGRLIGYYTPSGEYVIPGPLKMAQDGGILVLEEFDALDPGVALVLNSLLAQRIFSIGDQTFPVHKNFMCIALGNTDLETVDYGYKRQEQDLSVISRFVRFKMGSDQESIKNTLPIYKQVRKLEAHRKTFISMRKLSYLQKIIDAGVTSSLPKAVEIAFETTLTETEAKFFLQPRPESSFKEFDDEKPIRELHSVEGWDHKSSAQLNYATSSKDAILAKFQSELTSTDEAYAEKLKSVKFWIDLKLPSTFNNLTYKTFREKLYAAISERGIK